MRLRIKNYPRINVVISTALLLLIGFSVSIANAQLGGKKATTQLIPDNAIASLVLFPKKIADDPSLDMIPREMVTAWGLSELGIDPMMLSQVTFVVKELDGFQQPPLWGAILQLGENQALAGNLIDRFDQITIGGKTVFSGSAYGMPSFMVFDETTIIAGDEAYLADFLSAKKSGSLVGVMKGSRVSGQVQGFVDIKSVRPLINQALGGLPPLPPQLARLRKIPKIVDSIEIGVTAGKGLKTTIIMNAENADDAKESGEIIREGIEFGKEMGINLLAAQLNPDDAVQEAWLEYVERIADAYQGSLTPKVSGAQLALYLDEETAALPFLLGMGLPAVQQVRQAARRTQSMNNVRQMSLACLNYESAMQSFPAQATYDDRGKPLLSWRVQILPFIEQQELYDEFHHDEPWDSPHNKKLIKKMPLTYMSPAAGDLGGKTTYLGIAGEGTIFDGKTKRTFGDITDGSSNTALMVEVNRGQAVPWTKPADYEFNEKRPMQGLGQTYPGGFIVNFADGSVHFISNSVDPKTWKNLLTIGDGNVIDSSDF